MSTFDSISNAGTVSEFWSNDAWRLTINGLGKVSVMTGGEGMGSIWVDRVSLDLVDDGNINDAILKALSNVDIRPYRNLAAVDGVCSGKLVDAFKADIKQVIEHLQEYPIDIARNFESTEVTRLPPAAGIITLSRVAYL